MDRKLESLAQLQSYRIHKSHPPKQMEEIPKDKPGGEVDEEDSCQATKAPSCCACQGVAGKDGAQVMGQIVFEDFIMDNVYVKK